MAWCLPVWREMRSNGDVEEFQEILPSTWVNQNTQKVYWPPTTKKIATKSRIKHVPTDTWNAFDLVKIKLIGKPFIMQYYILHLLG